MADQNHHMDTLERYLNQEMSEEERNAFEQKLQEDPSLAEELSLQKDIMAGMDAYFRQELKLKLQEEEKDIRRKKKGILPMGGRFFTWSLAVAASILFLVLGAYFFLYSRPDQQALFQAYYKPYPNIVAPIERSGDAVPEEASSYILYERGNYQEAAMAFEEAITETPQHQPALHFYYALSLLNTGRAGEAIEILEELSNMESHSLKSPARWYLGLAYLKTAEEEKARRTFAEIADSSSAYQEKAAEILDKL